MTCDCCEKEAMAAELNAYRGLCEECWTEAFCRMVPSGRGDTFIGGKGKRMKAEKGWSGIEYPTRFLRVN